MFRAIFDRQVYFRFGIGTLKNRFNTCKIIVRRTFKWYILKRLKSFRWQISFLLTTDCDIYFRFRFWETVVRHTFIQTAIAHIHIEDIQLVQTWNHPVWQRTKPNLFPRNADRIPLKLTGELSLFAHEKNLHPLVSCTDFNLSSICKVVIKRLSL